MYYLGQTSQLDSACSPRVLSPADAPLDARHPAMQPPKRPSSLTSHFFTGCRILTETRVPGAMRCIVVPECLPSSLDDGPARYASVEVVMGVGWGEGGSVDRVNQLQACFCCRPPGPTMGGRMLPRPSSSSDRLQPAATSWVFVN